MFKRGAPCRKRIACTITRATVVYQQIDNGKIANQIHGFIIKYRKFILIIAGEQERDRRLILLSVVSGTFLKRTALEPT